MFKSKLSQLSKVTAIAAVAASAVMFSVPQAAHAFLVTRSNSISLQPTNLGLPAPTVIDFDDNTTFPNNQQVPSSPTTVATSSANTNGNAKIQLISGFAEYQGNQLDIGRSGNQGDLGGVVSFTFDAPKGLGYFGLQWQNPTADEVIRFYSGNTLIQTITGATLNALSGGGNYYNFFVTNNSEIFNRVDLAQVNPPNGNFFRIDDIAYQQIPTPALLPGLVGMGVGLLRKKRKQALA